MKGIVISTMIMIFLVAGAIPVSGQDIETEKLKQYYKHYISKCISKNQSKSNLYSSKSAVLRSCAVVSQQKVVFLTNYQDTLIDELMVHQVGTKPYKVDYYLNKRFHQIYH